MAAEWSAERLVSASLAESLIAAQFPQLVPVHAGLLGVGWDNTAFLVNNALVFRFPRRRFAVPLLEAETRLLPALAPRLPLAVPDPCFCGRPCDEFSWPFAGYRLIPGRTVCRASLDARQRAGLAEPLGRFLAVLHGTPRDFALTHGAGGDTIRRLDVTYRRAKGRERLQYLAEHRLVEDVEPLGAVLDAAPADYVPRSDTLVHGDLYSRHLLVDADGKLSGVIDWGDVHLGDPALDLAIAFSLLPPEARVGFWAAYGPVDEAVQQLARFRAACHTLVVAAYAHQIADAELLRESQVALGYVVAVD